MTQELVHYGLALLFVLVAVESAGVPLPGETALIAAAILSQPGQEHHFSIVAVIAVAALAAIVGDNVGYALGRYGGRTLLERWGPAARYADRALPPAEKFFSKHGGKSVFFGRFIAVLRVTVAWLAGITHMTWWRFFLYNAAGGIVWATTIGLLAYYVGKAAADAISKYGLYAVGVIAVAGAAALVGRRWWRRRKARA
ncbi:MAG TPA: DedA family protein [Gaiellaceae bacterium]|jgi:membrane protein DedA with SNARE-associated domain